jgi:HD-GYP domain-containing protein (c-di-GMP phosphodiesterase class II)
MFQHKDHLAALNHNLALNLQLEVIHNTLKLRAPYIVRIAICSYDKKSGMLKTFISSNYGQTPLAQYEASLEDATSLQEILEKGHPRVVNDLAIFDKGRNKHTRIIKEAGFSASYTMPMYQNSNFWGFIFFNSNQADCFNSAILDTIDVYGHLISSLVTHEITAIQTLLAALKTANDMVHSRDPETGGHLERMARFSRLIAQDLASKGLYEINDEFVEYIFLFAPMHDIGKIGIPDDILLKPGKLNEKERKIMQTHVSKGRQLVEDMIDNFGFESFQNIDVLKNIAECHHEALDGTGYPNHLKGEKIPFEARIIAVADTFDALTSQRPYKAPWDNQEAFQLLHKLSKDKLDKSCVDALLNNADKVAEIQQNFTG